MLARRAGPLMEKGKEGAHGECERGSKSLQMIPIALILSHYFYLYEKNESMGYNIEFHLSYGRPAIIMGLCRNLTSDNTIIREYLVCPAILNIPDSKNSPT